MGALNNVFPDIPVCVVCGIEKGVVSHTCAKCSDSLERLKAGCIKTQGLTALVSYRYECEAESLIKKYKYDGARWLSAFIANSIMRTVFDAHTEFDFICNVPLHKKKRESRGFDQSELIAAHLAQYTAKPYVKTLDRVRNTPTQTKLSIRQRQSNVEGAFSANAINGHVLLIDDVITTGATVAECAKALMQAGAKSVKAAAFAYAKISNATTN